MFRRRNLWPSIATLLVTVLVGCICLRYMYLLGPIQPSHDVAEASYKDFPNITTMLRLTGSPYLLKQFYCIFLSTFVLFWPGTYGKLVLVLDAEKTHDHHFGKTFIHQVTKYLPEYDVAVHFEDLPEGEDLLDYAHTFRKYVKADPRPGYNRQLWSTFYADLYTTERIIAYMDADVQFHTPMTKENIFNNGRLRVFGGKATKLSTATERWSETNKLALGLPMVTNFMMAFPQFAYRDTFTNCRHFIEKRFNSSLEKALDKLMTPERIVSSINVIMNYAWYFEKDRYDWHINSENVDELNEKLPAKHRIQLGDTIPSIVPTAHVFPEKHFVPKYPKAGYCMTMKTMGFHVDGCVHVTHNVSDFCQFHVPDLCGTWPSAKFWCKAAKLGPCCQLAMEEHYRNVAKMIQSKKHVHTFDKTRVQFVHHAAREMGVTCEAFNLP